MAVDCTFDGIFAWSDSKIVLAWLQGTPQQWKSFVANRVSETQEIGVLIQWCYVPTDENLADITSCGATIEKLKNSQLWSNGPEFLQRDESHWSPTEIKEVETER